MSVRGANGHPTHDLMGAGGVEFHIPRKLGRVNCKSYKEQMLIRSIKAKKCLRGRGWAEGKLMQKVPYVRARIEHSPKHAGLCSLRDYQVARWYAKPENHNFLLAYVRPHYAVLVA